MERDERKENNELDNTRIVRDRKERMEGKREK
jgi:hypothetical protein